jgi:hypothetical protein
MELEDKCMRNDIPHADRTKRKNNILERAIDYIKMREMDFQTSTFHTIRSNLLTYLITTGVYQGLEKESSRKLAIELIENHKDDSKYKKLLHLVQDKIIQHEKLNSGHDANNLRNAQIVVILPEHEQWVGIHQCLSGLLLRKWACATLVLSFPQILSFNPYSTYNCYSPNLCKCTLTAVRTSPFSK